MASETTLDYDSSFYYEEFKENAVALEIVMKMKKKPLVVDERFPDVAALIRAYPVFGYGESTCIDIVFKDLKAKSDKDLSEFHLKIQEELDRLLQIANYFQWIKSVTYETSRRVYFGVLAMLLKRNIFTGSGVTPFVMRCNVLYYVIAKKQDPNKAAQKYIFEKEGKKENKRKRKFTDSFVLNLENLLCAEAPIDDIKVLDDLVREVPQAGNRMRRLFRAIQRRMKALEKNELREFSRKVIAFFRIRLESIKRQNSFGNTESTITNTTQSKEIVDSSDFTIVPVTVVDAELQPGDVLYCPYFKTDTGSSASATSDSMTSMSFNFSKLSMHNQNFSISSETSRGISDENERSTDDSDSDDSDWNDEDDDFLASLLSVEEKQMTMALIL